MSEMLQQKTYSTDPRPFVRHQGKREFILYVLVLGSILLSFVASMSASISFVQTSQSMRLAYLGTYATVVGIFLLFCMCYIALRKGKSRLTAYTIIGMYILGATFTAYTWGADIPQALLINALIVVMSGILVSAQFAFLITFIVSAITITLTYLQNLGILTPEFSWRQQQPSFTDPLTYAATFIIIATVSWLFNQGMEDALRRARRSEEALRQQRDELEVKVEKRTQQLKQAQIEKVMQLYRFAEFGRFASGLFHDFASPLTLTSLNLQQLAKHIRQPELVDARLALDRAILGTRRLETFILAARRQIQDQATPISFSLRDELLLAIQIPEYRAKAERIRIQLMIEKDMQLYGNPMKFNQLIGNLLANAIDSYEGVQRRNKVITISAIQTGTSVEVQIADTGSGIKRKHLTKIFDPLFTTKHGRGTGIGLSICKDIIEKDFHGTYSVVSKEGKGTTFTIRFPI